MRIASAVLGALLLAAPAVAGERPAPPRPPGGKAERRRLSLKETVARALKTAERIAAARAGLQKAGAAVGEAASGALPQISVDGGYARSKRELTAADRQMAAMAAMFGGSGGGPARYGHQYTAGVQLTQQLFAGGRILNGIRAAKMGHKAAGEDLRLARLVTISAAAGKYYAAVLAREVHKVRQSIYEQARKHYGETVTRQKAGAASLFDVLRAKVAMQNQEAQVIGDEFERRRARIELLREVGLPQDAAVELVTPFGKPGKTPGFDQSMSRALARRPELAGAGLGIRAQEYSVKAARSGCYPTISGSARWGGQSEDDPFQGDNFDESGQLGVELRWNLFDGMLTRSRVAGARADLARLEWQRKGLARDIELEVRRALLDLEIARRFIEAQGANVKEAAEALRLAGVRQKAGAATELDVQDSRTQLQQARLNYAASLFKYAMARLDLDWATGALETEERYVGRAEAAGNDREKTP